MDIADSLWFVLGEVVAELNNQAHARLGFDIVDVVRVAGVLPVALNLASVAEIACLPHHNLGTSNEERRPAA